MKDSILTHLTNTVSSLRWDHTETTCPILREISKYFSESFKETIHPSQIDLKQEINKTGKFSVLVNLHSDIVAELHVLVEKKDLK